MHVPGVTIDRQCGSAQQAVQFGAQAVMSGTMDVGGVENMSLCPSPQERRPAKMTLNSTPLEQRVGTHGSAVPR